jgi:predicted Zn-dependent protease
LPHLEKATALNPRNEVAYYRLAQVYRALGDAGEQKKALAEFQRLRAEKAKEERSLVDALSPSAVTRQEVDVEAGP